MERLARLQREMTCQAAIVLSGVNRFYLTGFASSAGTLVITRERLFLLVDSRYIQAAQERVQNCEVLLEEGPGQLAGLLQSLGIESAAFETNYITVERAAQLRQDIAPVRLEETPDFGKLLLKMRRHKDDYELECLRKAVDTLGTQDQDLIELRYGRSLTMEEIGINYGVSTAAVSKRLKKFHEQLRGSVL